MNINTLFLVGLTLIEFGIIIYLLFKVDNFQRKVNYIIINTLQKNYHAFLLQERRKTITFFNDFW